MVAVGMVMMMTVVVWWSRWWGGSRAVAAWCWGGDVVLTDGLLRSSGACWRCGGVYGSVVTDGWRQGRWGGESPRLKDCPMNVLESLQTLSAEEKEVVSYLKQHEYMQNENRNDMERIFQPTNDPLSLVSNAIKSERWQCECLVKLNPIIDYNCKGIVHIARESSTPKRPQDSDYVKEQEAAYECS
ncbi:hypothetical protein Tco_0659775 [Tanacetum coccineum]